MKTLPFGKPITGPEEEQAILEVVRSGILVHGPKAHDFEEAFQTYTKAPHAVSCASCTAGLHLVYFHLRYGPGDEVIVPAQTHTATAHAVELTGATPVFVDAEARTGNIDLEQIEAAITPRTKAISVVHYLGMPVDMERVNAIAKKHNLFVVEDCALGLGTYLRGIHAGLWGDVGCFSFYPVKHMTTAEGGMITTRDGKLAQSLIRERAFGVDRTPAERQVPGVYDVTMLGFNYRMSELEAAMGIEQLKRLPEFLRIRKANYAVLAEGLGSLDELRLLESSRGDYASSYYCLSLILSESLQAQRFDIVNELKARGVGTSVYYPRPVPHLSYYRQKYGFKESSFPVAASISYRSIALPVGPHLNADDMEYMVSALKESLRVVKRS